MKLPADPRKAKKGKRLLGGWLAPWRNPALNRDQRITLRVAQRRLRVTGDEVQGQRVYSRGDRQTMGTNEGRKADNIFARLKRAFAVFAGGQDRN
jgi:hypothetical protein